MRKRKLISKVLTLLMALLMVMVYMPTLAFATDAVASITKNGETKYYDTLNEATTAAESGDIVVLLKDLLNRNNTIEAKVVDKSITLDLNGHKISGNYNNGGVINTYGNYSSTTAHLTITDNSLDKGGSLENTYTGSTGCGIYQDGYSILTLTNVSVKGAYAGVIQSTYYASDNQLTVGNGASVTGASYAGVNISSGNSGSGVIVDGGEINGGARGVMLGNSGASLTMNSGSITGTTWGVVASKNDCEIEINGGTITGRTDYGIQAGTLSSNSGIKIEINKGTVLGGQTGVHFGGKNSSIIINDGLVKGDKTGIYVGKVTSGTGNRVTVTGGTVCATTAESETAIALWDSAQLEVTGGTVESKLNGFAIANNGSNTGETTIDISGGNIEGKDAGIYHPGPGNLTITKGTVKGSVGIYLKGGKTDISGGRIIADGDKAEYVYDGSGMNPTGDAIVVDSCNYPSGTPEISVTGGAFYSKNAWAVASYTYNEAPAITGFLKGGIYGAGKDRIDIMDVASAKDLIAEGYIDIPNPDDETNEEHPWMIGVPKVAKIVRTGVEYETLDQAIIDAENEDTIVLLRDIKLSGPVRLDKEGIFTIDGDGHKITATENAEFGADGCMCFGKGGGWDKSEISKKIFTIKNTKFTGFRSNVNDVIRAEGCTLKVDNCDFTQNTIAETARSKAVVLLTGVNATIINSTFGGNSAGLCIDFNTQGGSANPENASNIKIDNCHFYNNTLDGNGVIYLYGPKGKVTNNTFHNNTINADGAAVIYLSGKADRIANNLFNANTITAEGTGKLGVIAFGSSAKGTVLEENAFVKNTLNKNDKAETSGTAYVGAEEVSVEYNYWNNGKKPVIGDEKDIYAAKETTVDYYATAYTKKSNSWGVNVSIAKDIAKYGTKTYNTYEDAIAAAGKKFDKGWYFNIDPSNDLKSGCIVVASDKSGWMYMVIEKAVDTEVKTDVEPGEKEAKAKEGNETAQEAAEIINDVDKTLGGVQDLQPDATSKLNDSKVINEALETKAKKALQEKVGFDEENDTLMLVIEPYFDVNVKDGKKATKINSITYDIDAKYNILATTASTTEQIVKEGVGQNTVVIKTGEDLQVTKSVALLIAMPWNFDADDGDVVLVKHNHGKNTYLYDGIIIVQGEQKFVSFINPDGFSTFEILTESTIEGAKIERKGEGTLFYNSLAEAIEAVQNKETIVLLSDSEEKIFVGREIIFTIDNDGHINKSAILAKIGYILNKDANTYTFIKDTPNTGDSNNIGLFVGLGGVSLLAIIVLAILMLRKKTYR